MPSSGPRSSSGPAGESPPTSRGGADGERTPTNDERRCRARRRVAEHGQLRRQRLRSGRQRPPRRVLDAIRILNYTPNESARNLKRQSASTIGLIVPDLANQYFALVAEGVERAASERGVLVVLCVPQATGKATTSTRSCSQPAARRGRLPVGDRHLAVADPRADALRRGRPGRRADAGVRAAGGGRRQPQRGARDRPARDRGGAFADRADRRAGAALDCRQRLAGYREALAAAGHNPDEIPSSAATIDSAPATSWRRRRSR